MGWWGIAKRIEYMYMYMCIYIYISKRIGEGDHAVQDCMGPHGSVQIWSLRDISLPIAASVFKEAIGACLTLLGGGAGVGAALATTLVPRGLHASRKLTLFKGRARPELLLRLPIAGSRC